MGTGHASEPPGNVRGSLTSYRLEAAPEDAASRLCVDSVRQPQPVGG